MELIGQLRISNRDLAISKGRPYEGEHEVKLGSACKSDELGNSDWFQVCVMELCSKNCVTLHVCAHPVSDLACCLYVSIRILEEKLISKKLAIGHVLTKGKLNRLA